MIAHNIPHAGAEAPCVGLVRSDAAVRPKVGLAAGHKGRHGPVRVALHVASRRQGPGVDSGSVSRRARTRWVRGHLLLSGAWPASARCWWSRASGGDRELDRALCTIFGRTRAACRRALRHERGAQARGRGQGVADRAAQDACWNCRCRDLRGSRPQVSDLGARPLSRGTRGGHREGSRAQTAVELPDDGGGSARSTGMMTGSGSGSAVAGGLARHIPVLGRRAVEHLAVRDGGIYLDATFGAGGYSRAILAAASCNVIAIDRDPGARAQAADLIAASHGRFALGQDRFSNLAEVAARHGHELIDGIVFDLAVSSMQLDEAARGFSFRHDGPLDMRMAGAGPSAADVVAQASEHDLAAIIATLGDERLARAVARAIVRERAQGPIRTTRALAEIVARVVHARPGAIHPATRTFQALRMFVNEELAELAAALKAAETVLRPGGRLVVVTFHSLEDRLVKTFLNERGRRGGGSRHQPEVIEPAPSFRILTGRPVTPEDTEIAANPRARSAKLRAAERTDAPPRRSAQHSTLDLLPRLPSLADVVSARRR